jgi:post-segregation antitoxin (ccd killing protein)
MNIKIDGNELICDLREKIRKKQWKQENKEKIAEYQRNYKLKKKQAKL